MTPVEKWIAALESGEFEQGDSVLRDENDKYCCLGVACELAVREGIIPKPELVPAYTTPAPHIPLDARAPDRYEYDGCSLYLPESVRKWLGLSHEAGTFTEYEPGDTSLANMNDSKKPFSEIAATIRRNPEGLFD